MSQPVSSTKEVLIFTVNMIVGIIFDVIIMLIYHMYPIDSEKFPNRHKSFVAVLGVIQVILNVIYVRIITHYKFTNGISTTGLFVPQSLILGELYGVPLVKQTVFPKLKPDDSFVK